MNKRHYVVTDEIAEFIRDMLAEISGQIDCRPDDRMVEIDDDTPETVPLSARIEERYTAMHLTYYSETVTGLEE